MNDKSYCLNQVKVQSLTTPNLFNWFLGNFSTHPVASYPRQTYRLTLSSNPVRSVPSRTPSLRIPYASQVISLGPTSCLKHPSLSRSIQSIWFLLSEPYDPCLTDNRGLPLTPLHYSIVQSVSDLSCRDRLIKTGV